MDIITEIKQSRINLKTSLTFGNFDGIHIGHQKIIKEMIEKAKIHKIESVLVTFSPHPQIVIGDKKRKRFLLQSFDEKLEYLEKTGIDKVICIKFDREFSKVKPIEFIELLVKYCSPKYIFSSRNNFFGYKKEGNFSFLDKNSKKLNYEVIDTSYYKYSGKIVSSSLIRDLIGSGDLISAEAMLGRPFSITGVVVKGKGIGRKIGYPTANLDIPESIILPKDGVYYVNVLFEGRIYIGMCNIGFRPTINSNKVRTIEVHIINYTNINLYKKKIKIIIIKFIRNETKFESLIELKEQLSIDKQLCLDFLNTKGEV